MNTRLYIKEGEPDKGFSGSTDAQFGRSLMDLYGNPDSYRLPTLEEALREAKFPQAEHLAKECVRKAKAHMRGLKAPMMLTLEDIAVLAMFFGDVDSVCFDLLNAALAKDPPLQHMRGLLALLLVALRKLPVCVHHGALVFYSELKHADYKEGERKCWNRFIAAIEAFEASGLTQVQKFPTTFIVLGKKCCYDVGSFFERGPEFILEPGTVVTVNKRTESVITTEVIPSERVQVLKQFTNTLIQKQLQQYQQQMQQQQPPLLSPPISPTSPTPQQKSPMMQPGTDCSLLSKTFYASSIHWNGCIISWSPVNFSLQPEQNSRVVYQVSRRMNVFTPKSASIVYEGTDTTVEYTDLEPDIAYEFHLRYGIPSDDDGTAAPLTATLAPLSLSKSGQQNMLWSKWSSTLRVKTPKLFVNTEKVAFHIEYWHTVEFDIKIPTLVSKKAPNAGKSPLKFHVVQNLKGESEQISQIFDTNKITLRNLLPDSEYDVKVRVSRTGEDKWSGFTAFNVITLKLQPPPGFVASARHWHKIRLTWGTPAGCDSKAVQYRVDVKTAQNEFEPLYEGFSTSYSYEKLSPETEYTFRAYATLDNKRSDWTETSARTPAIPPFEKARWKECPESVVDSPRGYVVGGSRGEAVTFLGTDCAVVPYEALLVPNTLNRWGVKVRRLPEGVNDARGIWFGVAPYDIDQSTGWRNLERAGWYFWCGGPAVKKALSWSTPMLFSGPPHNYKRLPYGDGKVRSFLQEGDVVMMEMDMVCGDLSFVIKGEECTTGPAYTGIPLDVPLVPVVNITRKNTSVEFILPQLS